MIDFKKHINKKNIIIASVFFTVLFLTTSLLFYYLNALSDKPDILSERKSSAKNNIKSCEQVNIKQDNFQNSAFQKTTLKTKSGVKFVTAVIQPIEFELNDRSFGWRPNDLIKFTDNVNNFQLGVLEVTRRSVVILAERITRTGSTASFDKNLANAMNWFMVKSNSYWFPSAESKYKAGVKELNIYIKKLLLSDALFFTRTDNLIPLLSSYEDLLGSCDEDLIKQKKNGENINSFTADNYFYYAQGVASSLYTILKAVQIDFKEILNSRGGVKLLEHAIESCHIASNIDPWLITDCDFDGIFANHRANMAAPISHARFYLSALIKTLST